MCGDRPPVAVTTLTYECTALEPMQEYTITITAVNGAGEGPSATVATTTACQGTVCNSCQTVGKQHEMYG